jgi:hypothetical protein
MRRLKVKAVNKLGHTVNFDAMGINFSTLLEDAKRRLIKKIGAKAKLYKIYIGEIA